REDAEAQDVLLCVQTGTRVTDRDRLSMLGEDFSIQTTEAFAEAFRDVPEALENTVRIAERCTTKLTFGKSILPSFPLSPTETPDAALRRLAEDGMTMRYGAALPAEARERMEYELGVIEKTGFAGYFLIVQDFVNWAKRQGIFVGPGRGSAAGSLISYLLNITNIDPLKHRLVFERFLNPERISMPDIDLDFADDRREEVLQYVRERYGRDHVAQIITFGTMAARAAVRDVGRALGFPYTFCDKVAKLIPFGTSLDKARQESKELRQLAADDPQVQRLLDTAKKLEGVARHASTHAAGVVITPSPLVEHVPVQRVSTDDATIVTQYEMHAIENLGLLKIDFLGLKNLTILGHALRVIREHAGVNIDLDALPLDDAPTYRTLQEGLTTGVFQLESAGMKRNLKELKPTEFEDIIAMVSLYRPGPMELIPQYVAGKHGLQTPKYLHPALEPILKKTYGIAVYQEQVLEIARAIAGFTLGEADILRKAVGKKIEKLLKAQKEKFIDGAVKNGVDTTTAEKIFAFIEPFANYGFNRAHAACYALIAYQTAYLKTHYPAAFMAALLTSDENDTDRIAIEVTECTTMGIPVLPPDVNESGEHFTVVTTTENRELELRNKDSANRKAIRFGLVAVKNVGAGVVRAILDARASGGPFRSLAEFFQRVQTREFNRKAAESLIKAGALDALGERNAMLENLDMLLQLGRNMQKQELAGQGALFGGSDEKGVPSVTLRPVPPAPATQRLQWEKQLLGLYVSGHPVATVAHLLAGRTTPMKDISTDLVDYSVCVGGIVTHVQKVVTRSRETMAFVTLEDQTGSVEVLVFPKILEAHPDLWAEETILIVEGRVNDRDGVPKILCEEATRVSETMQPIGASASHAPQSQERRLVLETPPPPYAILAVPPNGSRTILLSLKEFLGALPPGPIRVYLRVPKQNGAVDLVKTSFTVTLDGQAKKQLCTLLDAEAIEIASPEDAFETVRTPVI
ncbi:MAG: DNA polymerase III subunit alpha, partial [Parcubacteria group bacterium Gr01-1014_106]